MSTERASDTGLEIRQLVERISEGDEAAARELVRRFEPQIRAAVRVRLRGSELCRLLDSTDISQSVFQAFFRRISTDPSALEHPARLKYLLLAMARNKLVSHFRAQLGVERDLKRERSLEGNVNLIVAQTGESKIDDQLIRSEILALVRSRLTQQEQQLLADRASCLSWKEIELRRGISADAARKKANRAIERLRNEFGSTVG